MKAVYAINWTEYERGWGSRPDGHTLHISLEEAHNYIKNYGRDQRESYFYVPEIYSAPGDPKLVEVSDEVYIDVTNVGTIWGHTTRWI